MRSLALVLFTVSTAMTVYAQAAYSVTTLAALRDRSRPLLGFAGKNDPRIEQQYAIVAAHADAARDRDMRIVLITPPLTKMHDDPQPWQVYVLQEEQTQLRHRFYVAPGEFTAILIGKDGGEKLRSPTPIPWNKLAAAIDAMPMRQQEMRNR